jgi:predicted alpha/beta-hydrolase family hydrolase
MGAMTVYPAQVATRTSTLLVLAHGAGAGQSHPFMVRYARGLAERGIDVVTFNFPYMDTGRKSPDRAPVLEDAFRAAIVEATSTTSTSRLLIGGKSMGGRIATHLAAAPESGPTRGSRAWGPESWPSEAPPLDGVIVLGYPLHPPSPRLPRTSPPGGSRTQDRVSHLLTIGVPTLIVQGTRDSFGGPPDIHAALGDRQPLIAVHPVETGDHSFAILKSSGKSQAQVDQEIWDAIARWLTSLPRTASAT